MALSLNLKHLCFTLALLTITASCCNAQDAIAIVAKAALCFDNKPILNSCLASLRPNTTATGIIIPKNPSTNSTAPFCKGPCLGETMLMLNCVESILSSFQFYSPGMMQGVMSIFQMSCGGGNITMNSTTNSTTTQRVGLSAYGGTVGTSNNGNELHIPIQGAVWLLVLLASALML